MKDELKEQQQARLNKLKEDKQFKLEEKQVVHQVNVILKIFYVINSAKERRTSMEESTRTL